MCFIDIDTVATRTRFDALGSQVGKDFVEILQDLKGQYVAELTEMHRRFER